MFNFYETYCAWQRERGQPIPSYEWWCNAVRQREQKDFRDADQREIDRERSDGWAYGSNR